MIGQSPSGHLRSPAFREPVMMRLRTFGGLSLHDDAGPVAGVGGQRARLALLAALAAAGERGISRDRLMALFWPESDSVRARGALKQALYALRHDLGAPELILGREELRLNPVAISSDIADFEAARRAGDLEGAVAICRGGFLEGVHLDNGEFDRWRDREAERIAAEFRGAVSALAGEAERRNDAAGAARWWRSLAEADPANPVVICSLMGALARSGDVATALEHAAAYQQLMRTELEVAPDPAVAALADRLQAELVDRVTSSPNRPESPADRPAMPSAGPSPAPGAAGWSRRRPARAVALGAGAVAIVLVAVLARGRGEARFELGTVVPITADAGLEIQPAVSPDGRLVAYAAGPMGRMRVYVRGVGGGAAIPVAESFADQQQWPKWSPDGSQLLFASGFDSVRSVYLVPALGGVPRRLASPASQGTWAPDGRRIAFVGPGDRLLTRSIDGGEPRTIMVGADAGRTLNGGIHSPAWSPDGRWIAFVENNREWQVGRPGGLGNLTPTTLALVPAEGGQAVRITTGVSMNVSPQWLPDSRRLLFMSTRDGARDLYLVAIDDGGRPRGPPIRLTHGLDIGTFSLAAGGSRIVYTSFPNTSNVWVVPIPDTGMVTESAARPISTGTHHIEGLAVSPDRRWLAMSSDWLGNVDILVMPVEGGAPRRVTTNPAFDFSPRWSRDGRWLAFHSWRGGTRDLLVAAADGGGEVVVAEGPGDEGWGDWAPSGRALVFARGRELRVVGLGGDGRWGASRPLTTGVNPRWSPDGRWILALAPDNPGSRWDGNWNLLLIGPEGGPRRLLLDPQWLSQHGGVVEGDWDPSGRRIVFRTVRLAELVSTYWTIPIEGGRPRAMIRFTDPDFAGARPEFTLDGKRLFFTVDVLESDLRAIAVERLR